MTSVCNTTITATNKTYTTDQYNHTNHSDSFAEVAVCKNNQRRLATQLQRTFLQVTVSAGGHYLLSNRSRASKTDLTHFWVVNDSLTAHSAYNRPIIRSRQQYSIQKLCLLNSRMFAITTITINVCKSNHVYVCSDCCNHLPQCLQPHWPAPGRMLITPGGKPALAASSANLSEVRGVTWAGLSTTVLPAARQGEIFHANIISG